MKSLFGKERIEHVSDAYLEDTYGSSSMKTAIMHFMDLMREWQNN